jgi:hypothetical protein
MSASTRPDKVLLWHNIVQKLDLRDGKGEAKDDIYTGLENSPILLGI